MTFSEIARVIHAFSDKDCGHGATEREILDAEQKLNVHLPESYRWFLATFGWARFSYDELYGLGSDVPPHLDLVRNTLTERMEMQPHIPHRLVPIMNDGAGNHYCLDTSLATSGECAVVFWDHEQPASQTPETIADSFSRWIYRQLNQ